MKVELKHIVNKLLLMFMAIQILNQSIDNIEFQPLENIEAIGNFNDMNSATEYISEIILGHTNCFPEFTKKPNSKSANACKHIDLKLFEPSLLAFKVPFIHSKKSFNTTPQAMYCFIYVNDIAYPPKSIIS